MATSNGWLVLAVKLRRRNSLFIKDKLFGGITTGQLPSEGGYTRRFAKVLADIIGGVASGVYGGNIWATALDDSGTLSTGNIACVQASAAGDTITFTYGGKTVVLTEGATGANGFARGASNTTLAANLATCINAHPILSGLVTALASVGNCGLTAKVPTVLLQDIAMTTSDGASFTLTQLTGGTEGAAQFFIQQVWANRNK
jgi:hypothetical protein